MSWTIVGPIADRAGGVVLADEILGLPSDRYAIRQKRVPVLRDHGGFFVGQLEHLELDHAGQLDAVAVVDGGLDGDDTWFSPGVLFEEGGGNIRLRELSLTAHPATVGLRPCQVLPGDFRDRWTRGRWNVGDRTRELLERAAESVYSFDGLTVHGLEEAAPVQRSSTVTHDSAGAPAGELEYRTAGNIDVLGDRTLSLVAAPYGRESVFANTAFLNVNEQENRDRIRVRRDGTWAKPVGKVATLDPFNKQGLVAEIKVSHTKLGDETLELARDGLLDCEVGFRTMNERRESNSRRVTQAWLHHLNLVT